MSRIIFWKNFNAVQRRAIILLGASLVVGFFLSRPASFSIKTQPAVWREFVSSVPSFRIAMPAHPRHLVQDTVLPSLGITVTKGIFISEDGGGRQYVLAVATYPSKTPSFATERIVEAELQSLFQNTGDYRVDITTNEDGTDFSAVRFDGGSSVKGKVVVDGQEVYVLSFSAPPSLASDDLYQRFISSFQQ